MNIIDIKVRKSDLPRFEPEMVSQHFSQNLVSRNANVTTVSMHCIISLLKPQRTLQHGYMYKNSRIPPNNPIYSLVHPQVGVVPLLPEKFLLYTTGT